MCNEAEEHQTIEKEAGDMDATDGIYHLSCLTKLQNQTRDHGFL